jgi:hypothetical protein
MPDKAMVLHGDQGKGERLMTPQGIHEIGFVRLPERERVNVADCRVIGRVFRADETHAAIL